MAQTLPRPARRLWLFAPLGFVLLLAAAWSGVWFYAAHRAEATVAAWIEREAQAGRVHSCGTRAVGGYPFRIEMRCSEPRAELRGTGEPTVLRAASLLAVAQIYEPSLVIAELTGPMTVAMGAAAPAYTLDWKLMQASLRGFPWTFERVSLAIDGARLQQAGGANASTLAEVQKIELHARLRPQEAAADPVFDLIARAASAVVAGVPVLAGKPIDLDAEGVLRGVKDLSPQPFAERLRRWQADDGRLELTRGRIAQSDIVAVAKGEIGLSPRARLDGRLDLTVAGLDRIGGLIFGDGSQARAQVNLLGGLAMFAGRSELEGKRAVAVPLRFSDGAVFFGPLKVGQTSPLY